MAWHFVTGWEADLGLSLEGVGVVLVQVTKLCCIAAAIFLTSPSPHVAVQSMPQASLSVHDSLEAFASNRE